MHDLKRIFFISFGEFSIIVSYFKHNTVINKVTENGSGLTLGWPGTPGVTCHLSPVT